MRSAACRSGTAAGYPAEMPPYRFWRRDKNMKRRTILPEVPGIPNGSAPLSETYRPNEIYRVTLTGIFVNILLSAGKLIAGILGRSGAMLADAIHSISDFATDIIVLLSVNTTPTATKEEKPRYEYGKHETVVTVLIGLALLGVAIVIFVDSAHRISSILSGTAFQRPGLIAVVAAAVSIAAKEWLYRYTLRTGRRVKSRAVIANAWHHRSDAFSSIATLLGIGAARAFGGKWVIMDPVAAIVVGALIVKISIELVIPNLGDLLEKRLPASEEHRILEMISSISGIQDPHRLRARNLGTRIAVEMSIRLSPDMTVDASHLVTAEIEELLRREYGPETQVTVNVEPFRPIRWK